MPEYKSLKEILEKAQNVALVCGKVSSIDTAYSIVSIIKLLEHKGKRATLITSERLDKDVNKLLKEYGIVLERGVKPAEYTVTIDYKSYGIEKIVYDTDKDAGKLIFKIIPTSAGFSFDNVKFSEGGSRFDATILVNIENPKALKIYDSNEYMFKEILVCKLSDKEGTLSSEISEILPSDAPQLIKDILLKGVLDKVNILEGQTDASTWETISSIAKNGVDISQVLRKKYYSRSANYLNLVVRLMQNCAMDRSAKVIWSKVSKGEIDFSHVSVDEIDTVGRIPFNISDEFDLAFAFFETSSNEILLIVESNEPSEYSAATIAGVFGGAGDDGHASAILQGMKPNELDKRFWPVINDLYGKAVGKSQKSDSEVEIVDNFSAPLTKGRKNSKN